MTNFEVLKQMPLNSFANMVFNVARRECETEKEFIQFLKKEIPEGLEEITNGALKNLQCSVTD